MCSTCCSSIVRTKKIQRHENVDERRLLLHHADVFCSSIKLTLIEIFGRKSNKVTYLISCARLEINKKDEKAKDEKMTSFSYST
jgi:hypothetical protein